MVTKTSTTSLELQQDSADKRPILLIITHATGFFLILTPSTFLFPLCVTQTEERGEIKLSFVN
jgi:hypothetical protein